MRELCLCGQAVAITVGLSSVCVCLRRLGVIYNPDVQTCVFELADGLVAGLV